MALSTSWLNKRLNKPQEKEELKAHGSGLYARVRKTGAISFIYNFSYNGARDKITLGRYPDLSLADASTIRDRLNGYLANNKDPKREYELEKIKYDSDISVFNLCEDWWKEEYRQHPKVNDPVYGTPAQIKGFLKNHIYSNKTISASAWDDIDIRVWSDLLRAIRENSPAVAARLVTTLKSIGNYGVKHGLVKTSPLMHFSSAKDLKITKNKGKRVLSYEEIALIFDTLENSKTKLKTLFAFKLMLMYGCRSIELRLCHKSHLDFDRKLWTVPVELSKPNDSARPDETGTIIVRPLLPESELLFKILYDACDTPQGYLFGNDNLNSKNFGEPRKIGWTDVSDRISHKISKKTGQIFPAWSEHDLRRTMRTCITNQTDEQGLGVEPWLAEKMLGHKLGGVFEVYDKGQYIEEKKRAYRLWFDVLNSIWNKEDKVVELQVAAK